MSHYLQTAIEMTETRFLREALEDCGFDAEINKVPQHLFGYHGDERPEVAHVIVRRQQIRESSNDIGFFQRADGTFEAIISEYDRRAGFGDAWIGDLQQKYKQHEIMAVAVANGYTYQGKTMLPDGEVEFQFGAE